MSKRSQRLPRDKTLKAKKPSAEVVASSVSDAETTKRLGFLPGQFRVPDDFNLMDEAEIVRLFEGET